MDYEKAYKEAIDRMKSWVNGEHPECFSEAQKAAEFVFPELKEPEDERIRKNCIHFLELQKKHHAATFEIEECIAWLENQNTVEWSEEDEAFFRLTLITLTELEDKYGEGYRKVGKCIDWLKSIKERLHV